MRCSIVNGVVPGRYKSRPKVNPGKVVLQGKVTKLKQEVRHFDETFKEIWTAMLDFLNGTPSKAQQLQIKGGLLSLKSHVDEVLEAMKRVSLKEDNAGDDEEDDKEGDKVEEKVEKEKEAEAEEEAEEEAEAEEEEEEEEEAEAEEEEEDKEDD
ncbi:hypothetical protein ACN42_g9125 [Penicillium freii]|uniref:Uncharacterized protein n=1 Tax=Penicillium freii TaxID=48697 RepID=A0A101MCI4_PENFR|nr:hypothetical protein ACN42_g9125 [Penicillium freii]